MGDDSESTTKSDDSSFVDPEGDKDMIIELLSLTADSDNEVPSKLSGISIRKLSSNAESDNEVPSKPSGIAISEFLFELRIQDVGCTKEELTVKRR